MLQSYQKYPLSLMYVSFLMCIVPLTFDLSFCDLVQNVNNIKMKHLDTVATLQRLKTYAGEHTLEYFHTLVCAFRIDI